MIDDGHVLFRLGQRRLGASDRGFENGSRDGFIGHEDGYYQLLWVTVTYYGLLWVTVLEV